MLMEQLWGYVYTLAVLPLVDPSEEIDLHHIRAPLQKLQKHGVRWWDPKVWPQDFTDGKWEQQYPIPFLADHLGDPPTNSLNALLGMCTGKLL